MQEKDSNIYLYVQSGIQGSGWPVELCIPALFLRSRLL
ncbi:hypothetical protein BN2127_JRS8_02610 [Bacillus amyloliquefaciens]|nr:hypothetical protein BN2127_JRS8_02610 [Bacillus amyloliquefaciens]